MDHNSVTKPLPPIESENESDSEFGSGSNSPAPQPIPIPEPQEEKKQDDFVSSSPENTNLKDGMVTTKLNGETKHEILVAECHIKVINQNDEDKTSAGWLQKDSWIKE